jgi:hypothetical protein
LPKIIDNNAVSNPLLDIKRHRIVEKSFKSNPKNLMQASAANS